LAAREVKEQAAIRLEQTKLGVSLEVRSALTRLSSARQAYDVAISGLAVATEALRLAQLRFDEGAGILLDVTTAQAESTRAQGAVVTARYQYLSAVAALQKAVGSDDLSVGSVEEVSR
jgi:outer membrane protein